MTKIKSINDWKSFKLNENIQFDINNFRNLSKLEQANEIADILNNKYTDFEFNADGENVILNGDVNSIKLKEINNYITNLIGTNSIQVMTEANESNDHPAFKGKPYAPYIPLADKIMDLVSSTKPTHTTEEMLKACKEHDDKFEEYDDRNEIDKWTAEMPYQNETDADTQDFIKLVKMNFEELQSLTDEQISDLVYGTYAEYWFGHGYPYTNELVSLASRLYKALNNTKSTNENVPGTSAKFTDEELQQIASALGIEAVQINDQSGLPVFGDGKFTLIKHSDGFIEMLKYDDVTSEFKEFKSYKDLEALLEDLKDNKFQTNESEATDSKHTYMMLGRLSTDNDYYLGNGNKSPKCLWAGDVDAQIAEMKRLWNLLPQDRKPEWLSMEEILDYEKKMKESSNESHPHVPNWPTEVMFTKSVKTVDGVEIPMDTVLPVTTKGSVRIELDNQYWLNVDDFVFMMNNGTIESVDNESKINEDDSAFKDKVLSTFKEELALASNDKHDIESTYEEILASYKKQYPQYSEDFDLEFNKESDIEFVLLTNGQKLFYYEEPFNDMAGETNYYIVYKMGQDLENSKDVKFDEIKELLTPLDLKELEEYKKQLGDDNADRSRSFVESVNDNIKFNFDNSWTEEVPMDDVFEQFSEALKILGITEENYSDIYNYTKEDAENDELENEFFKFISMLKSLYTPIFNGQESEVVYDFNGVKVFVLDRFGDTTLSVNKKDIEQFNIELNKLLTGGEISN